MRVLCSASTLKKLTKQLKNNPDADGNLLPDYINYKACGDHPRHGWFTDR